MPGVETVATIRSAQAKLVDGGAGAHVSAPTPDVGEGRRARMEEGRAGDAARARDGQAILSDSFASEHGLKVGDRFRLLSQTAQRPSFGVVGDVRLEARTCSAAS